MNKYNIKKPKKKIYIGMIIGLILIALLSMPIWNIKDIKVENNGYYSKEEIIEASGIKTHSIWDLSFSHARKEIMKLSYIKNVDIKYNFPGNVIIKVVENAPFMYVPFSGSYLCLNEQGQVVSQTNNLSNPIPLVSGLNFSEFKIGEILAIQNDDAFLASKELINTLHEYTYEDKVKEIDVYNLEEIHLYVDNLDVIMGGIGDFDKKLQWLIATHKNYDMGILDLSQVVKSGQASLRPIT
ncbi:cell division protein FtsQ/DivIB [Cellulosilyticum ruminicola]|uniref:cell division protein FtsQ/DivIB n=1 Tax=Cellulosilyticum ruminicola TaxID=425254 RepID=UPI0006D0ACBC|nr:FtsQ-type POTRA domain-containing protein [Cellulosilyticum ruminicola]